MKDKILKVVNKVGEAIKNNLVMAVLIAVCGVMALALILGGK